MKTKRMRRGIHWGRLLLLAGVAIGLCGGHALAQSCASGQVKILYSSDVTGDNEIWIMDPDGTNQIQLTNMPASSDSWAHASPTGLEIEFGSQDGTMDSLNAMAVDGSNFRQLATITHAATQTIMPGDWSPTNWIYYARFGPDDIRKIRPDGTNDTWLIGYQAWGQSERADGLKVVYTKTACCWSPNNELHVMNPDGTGDTVIQAADGLAEGFPSYEHSSNRFVYRQADGAGGYNPPNNLYLMYDDGTGRQQITSSVGTERYGIASFSPDDTRLVVQHMPNGGSDFDIVTMNPDGTGILAITGPGANESRPSWLCCPVITLSPGSPLPAGTVGSAYNVALAASGGTAPYTFSLVSGTLPPGITLGTGGVLSGTPSSAGTWTFTVQASDYILCNGTQTYDLTVSCPAIAVTPAGALPVAVIASFYSQTFAATGGNAPYIYSVATGSLPAGLSLSSSTGVLSGTPVQTGTFSFTVDALDSFGCIGSSAVTLDVKCEQIILTPPSLPSGQVGVAYSQTITAVGGLPPHAFSVASGALPPGLTLSATGLLSGSPSTAGSYSFNMKAVDGASCEGIASYGMNVTAGSEPEAEFEGTPREGQVPFTVTFTDLSQGSPTSWSWDFGDGTTSTQQNPLHTYYADGEFTVSLTVSNASGSDTETKKEYIEAGEEETDDDFEAGNGGWMASGAGNDWEIGIPQGKAGDPGGAPRSGSNVYGTDLGAGMSDGAYEKNALTSIESPPVDCTGLSNVHLRYMRWLTVEDGLYDQARIVVNGTVVWQNPVGTGGSHFVDTKWQEQIIDISAIADDNPSVKIRFELQSDGTREFGGWNVDDVRIVSIPTGQSIIVGEGPGAQNGNQVKVFSARGTSTTVAFQAYGAGKYGTRVASGNLTGDPYDEMLTGPGPGDVFGPQVRAFRRSGLPLAKVNFYGYGTLKYGVNPTGGEIDGDAYAEIVTGAGPGAVFGPHVRGWNFDNTKLGAIQKISFFAYRTLRYGANVATSDVEGDGYREILTGPGPGAVFGPQVRGFDFDGATLRPIQKINFKAGYQPSEYGAVVAGGDADGDGYEEIVIAPGAGPTQTAQVLGFNYDGAAVAPLTGYDVLPFGTLYGARPGLADLVIGGSYELLVGAGPDPAADSTLRRYSYDGVALSEIGTGFPAFSSMYGVNVAGAALSY